MADFLNAGSSNEIVFGANMTTLTFSVSRAIGRTLKPGDEIIVTRLDHDANVSPWVALEEQGAHIKWADFDVEDCTLNLDHLTSLITNKTRLIAVGYASNAVGTINPIGRIAAMARNAGALLWVDAVHYAPHGPIDVQSLGCDFLVCSAYKFFGPHVGVLWGRPELLERLQAYKVRPAGNHAPHKFETGTLNHEGLAGVAAAIDYLNELGQEFGAHPHLEQLDLSQYIGRRKTLKQAMHAIAAYERPLFADMLAKLQAVPGVTVYGLTNPAQQDKRCPTLAFTRQGFSPAEIAAHLGNHGIFVWDGNYYAINVTERLGVEESGGMVRVGLAHYNTQTEVDRLIAALQEM
jgi:cysteine desulfurase family protein (TIGR01976 family)